MIITDDVIDTATDHLRTYFYGLKDQLIAAGIAAPDMFPEGDQHWRSNGPGAEPSTLSWSVHRGCGGKYLVVWEYLV